MLFIGLLAIQFPLGQPATASPTRMSRVVQSSAYSVGVTRCTFVDHTRSVPNFDTSPPSTLANVRRLVTEIRYPTLAPQVGVVETPGAQPAQQAGGFPMIVFAHGYDVTPDTYARLLDRWVKAGFIVAAPFFPDENKVEVAAQHGVNTEDDLWNEPADLAFVTRQILAASATPSPGCPVVSGLVRASALALAGHSDGATVVGMLSYAHGKDPYGVSYQTLRAGLDFRATIVMSGQEDGVDPYAPPAANPALLVIQSAADQCNLLARALKFYANIHQTNKWFLELRTAHHLPPFNGVDVRAFNVVVKASIRFLQITLGGSTPASGLVAYGNVNPPIARMFYGPVTPAVVVPATLVSCGPN